MAKSKSHALIFIDTNIFLDFYRVRGDTGGLSILKHLKTHQNRIITTGQVEVEFKNNRQQIVVEALKNFKQPEWVSLSVPAFLDQVKATSALRKVRQTTDATVKRMQARIDRVLRTPAAHDPVYIAAQRLFRADSPWNLDRTKKIRYRIRSLARKRFALGYPPRKRNDLSLGDAINWEWMIQCAIDSHCKTLIIVSRDSDYGVRHPKTGPILNDWLEKEFKERVSRQRKLILTDRLAEAFKLALVPVSAAETKAENELVTEIDAAAADTPAQRLAMLLSEPVRVQDSMFARLFELATQNQRTAKVLTNVLQPAAKAVGLGRVTWHQFRHIHSSLLNDLKVPVKIAQEQLGHASISTTLNIYHPRSRCLASSCGGRSRTAVVW
jgi:integrase